ncbi:hypothetical protein PIB30_074565, partial [Stylosanthes scabra]|nr:hypothetical protein [Stylosanthes scabra]
SSYQPCDASPGACYQAHHLPDCPLPVCQQLSGWPREGSHPEVSGKMHHPEPETAEPPETTTSNNPPMGPDPGPPRL